MTDYKDMNKLLQFLDVKNYPKMHWSNSIGWEMATYMHEVVVNKTQNLVECSIHFLFCDEVITCDQQSWVSIHAYVVEGWQKIPFLLLL
jgi:hypothetical protein